MASTAESGLRHRRPSLPLVSQARAIEGKVAETIQSVLLHWDDLPDWRRDNTFLLTSYRRPTPSLSSIVRSACSLHNETVNIWTHLLGALLFAGVTAWACGIVVPRYETASWSDVAVFGCYLAGAVACLGMSATYHAVSSHSEAVARIGNKLDYSGIVFLTVGSFVPALYYGFFCRPALMTLYMTLIATLGLGCTAVSWLETFGRPEWRPYRVVIFVSLGLSGFFPIIHGLVLDGYQALEYRMSLSLVLLEAVLYVSGAALYAVRWPERSFPHTFDIWGSSHQLFHVCVVAAAVSHLCGMTKAFDHHHTVTESRC